MLDVNKIRENPKDVQKALLKRGVEVDFSDFLDWDDKRKSIIYQSEQMKAERNKVSSEIPIMKKKGIDIKETLKQMKDLSNEIKESEEKLNNVESKINAFLEELPNLPDDDVQPGGPECNEVVEEWGNKPEYDYEIKNHVDICESLGIIDYKRGAKLSGSGYWIYKNDGALLEWALLNYFVEEHLKDGYQFILPPHILNYECGYTAGQFPKFGQDVFALTGNEQKDKINFLLPTSETALVNMHRNEILDQEDLPLKYFAYSPCYRREAGSYRAEERGMIRGHQFNKVEMFQYALPENSDKALDELVNKAKALMQGLGLHYRLSKLAAGDVSYSMAKTFDIEVWIPSMNIYKEVSSASNARDYQARRGKIRFRRKETGKTEFIHTLNASGLATSRVFPAIIEQFQNRDGTVTVPEVLRRWVRKEIIFHE